MRKIRLGIVGAGLIWNLAHKATLAKLDRRFEIMAFSVKSVTTAKNIRGEFPDVKVFNDYREMLNLENLDTIVVLTPISLNARVTIDALEAGKFVFAEKPLAVNLDDVGQIIELEKAMNRKVFVLEQFRYSSRLLMLKTMIDQGHIGRVVSYEMVNHGKIDQDSNNKGGYGNTAWRIKPDYPLGVLYDAGIHTLTQLSYLFSKPESVYALGSSVRSGFGEYDHISMLFRHYHDINGTLSYAGYLDDRDNYFFVRGTEGTLSVRNNVLEVKKDDSIRTIELQPSDDNLLMWEQLAAWFDSNETSIYGSAESFEDIHLLDGVNKSLKTGEKVTL